MSLPRYPAYKDSGVEWLGDVPEHWRVSKLKSFASFSGGGTPARDNLAFWNGDIPWVSPKDMKAEEIVGAEESITQAGVEGSATSVVPPGRVLMVVRSGILQHTIPVAINAKPVALNQDMKSLNFDPARCTSRFFLRWVQGLNDRLLLQWGKQGATVESIEHSYLANTSIPLPPVREQDVIAAFLDRETAKIDALVAEQERLIELLKEKRQAVISHAVTKGLNPNAPMKDSAIEWLGQIPAHFQLKKLRHVANIVRGASPRPAGDPKYFSGVNDSGTNTPWVTVAEVTKDDTTYLTEVTEYLTPEGVLCSQSFKAGTVVFTNSGATLGVPKILKIDCCANDGILAFKQLETNVDSRYLYHYLSTTTLRLRTEMKQGGGQPNLNTALVKDIDFPLPPPSEQAEIVEFINRYLNSLDVLRREAERAIHLFGERRAALISAAVTGQIDVRPESMRTAA